MKIQTIAPIDGRRWPVGHTTLVSEEYGTQLIEDGLAILHPTITDPAPTHPCPCQDSDEPCEDCADDEVTPVDEEPTPTDDNEEGED